MSTWTSDIARRLCIWAGLSLALAGCTASFLPGGSAGMAEVEAMRAVSVTSDTVVVSGPEGFCVDRTALVEEADSAFILLGNCAAILRSRRAPQPDIPALLTASISGAEQGAPLADSIPELGRFFRSEEGRALLSRSGDAERVTVLDSFHADDVFFLHARDTSDGALPGVARDYWRAYLDIGPRIATLSVLGMEDEPPGQGESLSVLIDLVSRLRQANPGPTALTDAAPALVARGSSNPSGLWRLLPTR